MRILQVTPAYYPVIGGVEKHVQALAERMVAAGHQVAVATMQPRGERRADETHNGVSIRRFDAVGLGDAYRAPLGLTRFLKSTQGQWDIVHVHNYHAALIPLAALAHRGPFVVTTHLNDTPHSRVAELLHVPYAAIGRWAVGRASAVICVTAAERERVAMRLGIPPERSFVIPNGVSEALAAARNSGGVGVRDPYLLLSVGRLQAYKRVEDAIGALARLDERYRLVVVGDGPQRSVLERLAASQGVSQRVEFVGKVTDTDLIDWYRRAGVVLALSEAEAFGMTVLEGVAAGCQVVCSDIPAFKDLASQFAGHVRVAPRRDAAEVAAAIRAFASTASTIPPADISAFTWHAVTQRVLQVYRQVLGAVEGVEALDAPAPDPQGDHVLAEG